MDAPTLDKGLSLAERLMADREGKQAEQGEFVGTVQMGGGYLTVFYRALSYREDRKIGQRHRMVSDEVERELRLAADTLASSSTRCEAHVGDEVEELPPLGVALTSKLGLDGPENDVQAVLALFPSERAMVEQFVELEEWATAVNRTVDKSIEGNSVAATS